MSPGFSLPRRFVLKKPPAFSKMYRDGERVKGKRIVIFFSPSESEGLRAGFSTGRGMRRAVDRNRARRLMREVFRIHRDKIRNGFHYLFLWSGPVASVLFRDVEEEMLSLLRSAHLIIPGNGNETGV